MKNTKKENERKTEGWLEGQKEEKEKKSVEVKERDRDRGERETWRVRENHWCRQREKKRECRRLKNVCKKLYTK